MRIIDLHAWPDITLHYFSTSSDRLRQFCKENGVQPGDAVLIVSRTDRVRVLEYTRAGFIVVQMVEHDSKLGPTVQAMAFYERRMQGSDRDIARALRREVERKIKRRERRKNTRQRPV